MKLTFFYRFSTLSQRERVRLDKVVKRQDSSAQSMFDEISFSKRHDDFSNQFERTEDKWNGLKSNNINESQRKLIELQDEITNLNASSRKKDDDVMKCSQEIEKLKLQLNEYCETIKTLKENGFNEKKNIIGRHMYDNGDTIKIESDEKDKNTVQVDELESKKDILESSIDENNRQIYGLQRYGYVFHIFLSI